MLVIKTNGRDSVTQEAFCFFLMDKYWMSFFILVYLYNTSVCSFPLPPCPKINRPAAEMREGIFLRLQNKTKNTCLTCGF